LVTHQPELLGWVHDSGATFRDELYPDYKATREKLTDELQADFDRGLERIHQLLAAYGIPVLAVPGFEADDVIGTLARKGVEAGYNVVIVSGDKDFQQLVRPGVWLLNPGRGGPASVEEQWVGVENANDRLGVPPERVIDYLALVGDASDNVPGVKGIGEKGAQELIAQFGALEDILARVHDITKKRPREALLAHDADARLSKQLVTIHQDVPIALDPSTLQLSAPDTQALRHLYLELEFTSLLKELGGSAPVVADVAVQAPPVAAHRPAALPMTMGASGVPVLADARYVTVDTVSALDALLARVREVPFIAFDTETVPEPDAPATIDAMRARLVGLSIAVAPGEAYYLPFAHRHDDGGGNLALLSGDAGIAGRRLNAGVAPPVNLPAFDSEAMAPLRAMLEDANVKKLAQNAKYDVLVLRGAGVRLAGLEFDTMLASYVLDPGRRRTSSCAARVAISCRSMWCRWMLRATIRARTSTSRCACARSSSPCWAVTACRTCSAAWRCRWSRCWPIWSGTASPSTCRGSRR
jgi:DNA polymerase-1